jgi:hypothetical protein
VVRRVGGVDLQVAAERFMVLVPDWASATLQVVGILSLASLIAAVALGLPPSYPYCRQPPEWAI